MNAGSVLWLWCETCLHGCDHNHPSLHCLCLCHFWSNITSTWFPCLSHFVIPFNLSDLSKSMGMRSLSGVIWPHHVSRSDYMSVSSSVAVCVRLSVCVWLCLEFLHSGSDHLPWLLVWLMLVTSESFHINVRLSERHSRTSSCSRHLLDMAKFGQIAIRDAIGHQCFYHVSFVVNPFHFLGLGTACKHCSSTEGDSSCSVRWKTGWARDAMTKMERVGAGVSPRHQYRFTWQGLATYPGC